VSHRLPSGWHREFDRLLRTLGYTLDESHGRTHLTYRHPDHQGVFTVACTPGAGRTEVNLLTQLRRRHPDHPALARQVRSQSATERKRRRRKNRTSRMTLVRELEPGVVETFNRPEKTACIDCCRRWLSDLDPRLRPCPACGGEIVFGRTEERWTA
jgi:predicted RNA binding protein YcfA (HicA-like mRNA interferase family)